MNNNGILIKLGGSVITDKNRYFTIRSDVIERLAEEIKLSGSIPIIVHGTGTVGKAYSRHYNKTDKTTDSKQIFQLTTRAIRNLSNHISDVLFGAGLVNCIISTAGIFKIVNGKVISTNLNILRELTNYGVIPIVSGDVLTENLGKYQIISSDLVMQLISRSIPIRNSIFVTDVDGVYDNKNCLISKLSIENSVTTRSSDLEDITGGMATKIQVALDIAQKNIPVTIINGLIPDRLRNSLVGKKIIGTQIIFSERW